MPRSVVPILRAPRALFGQRLEAAVVRQDQVGAVREHEVVVDLDALPAQHARSPFSKATGSMTIPLPITHRTPACRMPGRNQVQDEASARRR